MTLERQTPGTNLLPDFPPPGFVPGVSKLSGIEVYLPAEKVKAPEVMDFKCPQCGGVTAYNVETGKLSCTYCGYSQEIAEQHLGRAAEGFEFRVDTLERSEKGWGEARKELACQNCGGVISTRPDALSYTCPFCGSNNVLFREPLEDVLRPRCILPFKIDPDACRAVTRQWLGNSWMISAGLRQVAGQSQPLAEKFTPLYIPYWTFSSACSAVWKAQVAHDVVERHMVNGQLQEFHHVVWKDEAGKVHTQFTDLLVPGTTRFNLSALGKVDDYKVEDLVLYTPDLLAGMRAQAYDLPLEEAWDAGRQIMRDRTRQACMDRVSSTNMRNFSMSMDFSDEQWRYILAPIYTGVYHYNDKIFQILVNGQTGQIAGPRPVDWEKVWLVIAGMLAPGLLLCLVSWLFPSLQNNSVFTAVGLFLIGVAIVASFFILKQAGEIEHV